MTDQPRLGNGLDITVIRVQFPADTFVGLPLPLVVHTSPRAHWVLYTLSPGENRPRLTTYSCLVPRMSGALTSLPHTPSSYELQALCTQTVVAYFSTLHVQEVRFSPFHGPRRPLGRVRYSSTLF